MTTTKPLDPAKMGRALRSYATHHNHGEGWTYTRSSRDMEHIRYKRDYFLESEPEHPHAVAIAEEMRRVRQLGIDRRKKERETNER